jgi:hypothetical protein
VHGDTNGDGVFDTTDYLLAQEYSLSSEGLIGCPSFGGLACTRPSDLNPWQLKQMDAVSDPLLPASAPGGNDLGFLLSVYSGKQRFVAAWAAQSDTDTGLSLRVLLVERDGEPAVEQCSVRFILATTANKAAVFQTQSSVTPEGVLVLAEHKGDGWYGVDSIGALQAEAEVPFVFMIETKDGTGAGDDAMRRFPFYATQLPPYNLYFPAFKAFAVFRVHEYTPNTTSIPPSSTPPALAQTTETPEGDTTLTATTSEAGPATTPEPGPTPTPTPPSMSVVAEVSVAAGSSLVALIGLVEVARRYWNTAAAPAAVPVVIAQSAPVIRVRIRLPPSY